MQQPADTVLHVAAGTANDAAAQFPEQGRGCGDPGQLWGAPSHVHITQTPPVPLCLAFIKAGPKPPDILVSRKHLKQGQRHKLNQMEPADVMVSPRLRQHKRSKRCLRLVAWALQHRKLDL